MLSVIFYLTVFIMVFFIQRAAMRQKNKTAKKSLIILSFFIILLLIGLRYKVGVDYAGHIDIYNTYAKQSFAEIWSSSGDIGKKIIIGLAPKIFGDVKAIFWIYGLLTLYPIYKINKNSNFKYLAYSTLVFNLTTLPATLNIMRQGAAMSFALLAFDYLRHDLKWSKAIICIIIAAILHTSALLITPFFVAYILTEKYKKSFRKWAYIITVLESISFMTFIGSFFARIGFSDYDYMLKVSGSAKVYSGWILYNSIYYIILFFIYYTFKKGDSASNKKSKKEIDDELTMVVNGTIFEVVGTMTKFLSRISYYFSIYQILLIPTILQNITEKNSRITAKIICITSLVALFIFRCYFQGYYGIIPYQTWIF